MADRKSTQIIATTFSYGSKQDFQLFKENAYEFSEQLCILAMLAIKVWQNLWKQSDTLQEIQIPCSDKARKTGQSEFGKKTDCDWAYIP